MRKLLSASIATVVLSRHEINIDRLL